MPRPSLKNRRREEILDAYEICVAKFGVEGATLEKTAEEAGLARALLRHHVGNREELLDALVTRFLENSEIQTKGFYAALPANNRMETLISWLFDPEYSDSRSVLVAEALIAASEARPKLGVKIKAWVEDFVKQLSQEISQHAPQESPEAIEEVAMGITALYFNAESLTPLGALPDIRKTSAATCLRLLKSLKKGDVK
ncbi:MAG: TetR/AcrR family transcriptional regulator [Sneathiellales bacterium]|nr:TetR/AcrR family transcriptional regulator [Sneathiellales bacterium]